MNNKLTILTIICTTAFIAGLMLAYADQMSARAASLETDGAARREQPVNLNETNVLPAAGNLSILKFSWAGIGGGAAGHPISYTIYYNWSGDGPAPDVQITDQLPPQVTISSTTPPPDIQTAQDLVWNLGQLENGAFGGIIITGAIQSDVAQGTLITNTATITGDVVDQDPEDNTAQVVVEVTGSEPDLWLWKWGLFEELEEGFLFVAEEGVETSFELLYFNMSAFAAPDATVIDNLPAGIEYRSADPEPTSIDGQQLTWDLGRVSAYDFGEITIRVRPTTTGTLTNMASITTTVGDRDSSDNSSDFQFRVVPLLPPRLLKPNAKNTTADRPLIVGTNPAFEGLAKAGATVTLYEGDADGCWTDFSACNPTALVSTTAGSDRSWVLTPTTLTETRTYSLYLRAELDGYASEPPSGFWEPLVLRVDPLFEQAGWDMDGFVVESGEQETRPGGLGGTSGTTPNEPFTIKVRQEVWDSVPTSPTLRANHDLRLVISEDGSEPYTVTLPVSEFQKVTTDTVAAAQTPYGVNDPLGGWAYDLFYVQHGFGPGAEVQVWCRPVYYPDDPDELPIVGLVWTLCHEILVDPAGYVYDLNQAGFEYEWPEVPPDEALITNATVTATVRTGDDSWTRWPAEDTGQVNPQVTDYTTNDRIKVPGYYAFYVPSGQYRVAAKAPGCAPYTSPILTVVDAPIFHNVGMRCTDEAQTGVQYDQFLPILLR
jgi:hypothetical protein